MIEVMGNRKGLYVDGQSVIIAGGSKGLGRELAVQLVERGANVIVLARSLKDLETTKEILLPLRKRPEQWVEIHSVDLTDVQQVQTFVASLQELPSSLFCVAGGTAEEVGFFADISAEQIYSCFQKNYFSSAYITHALLRRWLEKPPTSHVPRRIVFTASTAALVAIPGYVAYTPTKTALRALADTLRQEVLLYESQQEIQVHCSFPGTITTETFAHEQKRKPSLCKQLEGSNDPTQCLPPDTIAKGIIAGIDRGEFCITFDFQTKLLINNMRGPSPPNFLIWDWILGFIISVAWPFIRRSFDRTTVEYGRKNNKLQ